MWGVLGMNGWARCLRTQAHKFVLNSGSMWPERKLPSRGRGGRETERPAVQERPLEKSTPCLLHTDLTNLTFHFSNLSLLTMCGKRVRQRQRRRQTERGGGGRDRVRGEREREREGGEEGRRGKEGGREGRKNRERDRENNYLL